MEQIEFDAAAMPNLNSDGNEQQDQADRRLRQQEIYIAHLNEIGHDAEERQAAQQLVVDGQPVVGHRAGNLA